MAKEIKGNSISLNHNSEEHQFFKDCIDELEKKTESINTNTTENNHTFINRYRDFLDIKRIGFLKKLKKRNLTKNELENICEILSKHRDKILNDNFPQKLAQNFDYAKHHYSSFVDNPNAIKLIIAELKECYNLLITSVGIYIYELSESISNDTIINKLSINNDILTRENIVKIFEKLKSKNYIKLDSDLGEWINNSFHFGEGLPSISGEKLKKITWNKKIKLFSEFIFRIIEINALNDLTLEKNTPEEVTFKQEKVILYIWLKDFWNFKPTNYNTIKRYLKNPSFPTPPRVLIKTKPTFDLEIE